MFTPPYPYGGDSPNPKGIPPSLPSKPLSILLPENLLVVTEIHVAPSANNCPAGEFTVSPPAGVVVM